MDRNLGRMSYERRVDVALPGFSPGAVRGLLSRAGLTVLSSEVACREVRKPHLEVVLAIADKKKAR